MLRSHLCTHTQKVRPAHHGQALPGKAGRKESQAFQFDLHINMTFGIQQEMFLKTMETKGPILP